MPVFGPSGATQLGTGRSRIEEAFVRLANGVTRLHPDDLPELARSCGTEMGGDDIVMFVVDLDQRTLRTFGGPDVTELSVDDSSAGAAYRREDIVVTTDRPDHARLWIPIMDSAERLGVLAVTL